VSRRLEAAAALGGLLALAGVFALLVTAGSGRGQEIPAGARQGTGWLDPSVAPAVRGGVAPPVDPATILDPPPPVMEKARDTYASLCAGCHGPQGRGDGPAGHGLRPAPRDFANADGWENGTGLAGILKTLDEGLPGSAMAPYRQLGRKERVALARVVMGFGRFNRGTDDREALLRTFRVPEGPLPNLIPVPLAMARLAAEAPAVPPLARAPAWAVAAPDRAARVLAARPGLGTSDAAFLEAVAAQIQDNGFAPSVLLATPARRRRLLEELR